MSKVVVVSEKPSKCKDCAFRGLEEWLDPSGWTSDYVCNIGGNIYHPEDSCPLIDLPKKKPAGKGKTLGTYNDGWNACLRTILGERN